MESLNFIGMLCRLNIMLPSLTAVSRSFKFGIKTNSKRPQNES